MCSQIHLNPAANRLTPTQHFNWQIASSILRPTFFLNLLLPRPPQPPFLPLTFNLKIQCPSQDMTTLSPQHTAIPTNRSKMGNALAPSDQSLELIATSEDEKIQVMVELYPCSRWTRNARLNGTNMWRYQYSLKGDIVNCSELQN